MNRRAFLTALLAAPLLPLALRRVDGGLVTKPTRVLMGVGGPPEIARLFNGQIHFWTAPSGTPFPLLDVDPELAGWKRYEAPNERY